jgi:iron complex transport system substrate-binding protein
MRICSFLPSATEIIYALNLQDELYGVTHECDYPPEARTKPKLSANNLARSTNSKEIDASVRESLQSGNPIYYLDRDALSRAAPDVIFTQELCEVCAVSYGEIQRASTKLASKPEVISLDTFTLKDIMESIKKVGAKCDRGKEADDFVDQLNARVEKATSLVKEVQKDEEKKKIFFMEWIDPVMSGGHWMAELIMRAGGDDIFAQHGKNSRRVAWNDVILYSPDYLVIAPCGFGVERAEKEARVLKQLPNWSMIPAVRNHNVYASDGNAYFSRPGPRIVDGLEILVSILNPNLRSHYRKFGSNDFKQVMDS